MRTARTAIIALALLTTTIAALPAASAMADPFPTCIRECNPVPNPLIYDVDAHVGEDGIFIDHRTGVAIGYQGVVVDGTLVVDDGGVSCGGYVQIGFHYPAAYTC